MSLTDGAILEAIKAGDILIEPFRKECLGSNSYDVHLGRELAVYGKLGWDPGIYPHLHIPMAELDSAKENPITRFNIPCFCEKWPCTGDGEVCGYLLRPGMFYLGSTEEYTETQKYTPWIDGKSSGGRLSIRIHATAGRGDIGFCNHWTLEIDTVLPVRVYAGMPIGQITYFVSTGEVITPYNKKPNAKYNVRDGRPVPSSMWRNFPRNR